MPEPILNKYDEIPYTSHPFAQSHPDRLATLGLLFGIPTPPVDHCQVLELGCAAGGNLIPVAQTLPESRFIGIDLSSRQVADGQKMLASLGLKNIELKTMSILDVTPEFGQFDYVIAHGVYSWVPGEVQDKILDICNRNLRPNGIAYVSYNTYPGWHMRGMIRDMMIYHGRRFFDPPTKLGQARALIDFLARSVKQEDSPFGLLLKRELEYMSQKADYYLLHEHLEDVNEPVYFYQFVERAAGHDLQYLGEAELGVMVAKNFPPEVENALRRLSPDLVHMEQYMDFLRNRMFRQTLLCHKELTPKYTLFPEQMVSFYVTSPARPINPNPDLVTTKMESFRTADGASLNSTEPMVKAAMTCLAEKWPLPIHFEELRNLARARLNAIAPPQTVVTPAQDTQTLGRGLLTGYAASRLVELHVDRPHFTLDISERPVASPVARYQAPLTNMVTNLRHELIVLGDFDRQLLPHMDGQNDQAALVQIMSDKVAQGTIQIHRDKQPIQDPATVREVIQRALAETLPKLARNALIVA